MPFADTQNNAIDFNEIHLILGWLPTGLAMRRQNIAPIVFISLLAISATVWSKGLTIRIAIAGDDLSAPIEITDQDILNQFSIWNGPGVSTSGPDGVPHPPAYLDPKRSVGRFIDWPKGMAAERPSGLQRLEVTFYIGIPREPNTARKYVFAYEVDSADSRGYIYLPRWKNNLISHGVEGHWFYASERWDELVMPIVAQLSQHSPSFVKRSKSCKVGNGSLKTDGTIEFVLLDEHGNKMSRRRYEPTTHKYQSVKDHIGNVQPGEEIEISCWPARS